MKSHFYGLGLAEIFVPPRLGNIPTSAGLTCLQFAVAAVATDTFVMTRSATTLPCRRLRSANSVARSNVCRSWLVSGWPAVSWYYLFLAQERASPRLARQIGSWSAERIGVRGVSDDGQPPLSEPASQMHHSDIIRCLIGNDGVKLQAPTIFGGPVRWIR